MGGLLEALTMLGLAWVFTSSVIDGFEKGSDNWWLVSMARDKYPGWFWTGQSLGALSAGVCWLRFFVVLTE